MSVFEVPQLADLDALSVEVEPLDAPGVVAVTAFANDGAVVTVTWDEMAGSVSVQWLEARNERLRLERETASKVSVREERGQIEFWIWSQAENLGGELVVRVGEHVNVSDALLRN